MKLEEFEHHMHKRFGEHESFDINEAALWEAIDGNLEEEKKNKTLWLWSCLAILLMGLASVAYWAYAPLEDQSKTIEKWSEAAPKKSQLNAVKSAIDNELESKEVHDVLQKDEAQSFKKESKLISSVRRTTPSADAKVEQMIARQESYPAIATKMIAESSEKVALVHSSSSETAMKEKEALYQAIDDLPTRFSLVAISTKAMNLSLDKRSISSKEQAKGWISGFEAGVSFSDLGIRSNEAYANLRKDTEETQMGWQLGWNLYRKKASGFVWGSGLNLTQRLTKFNFTENSSTQVVLEDVILQTFVDSASQDVIGNRIGDTTVTRYDMRNVQHYNEFYTLSIPVHFGYGMEKNRVSCYVLGGLSLDYHLRQKGKLANESKQIIDFEKNSFFKSAGITLDLKPTMFIHVSPNTSISLSSSIQMNLMDRMKVSRSFAQKPIRYNFRIGLAKMW